MRFADELQRPVERRPKRSSAKTPRYGAPFAFSNRRRNRIKILYFDGTGVCILAKRLEKGSFFWPPSAGEPGAKIKLAPQALQLLLDGAELQRQRRPRLVRSVGMIWSRRARRRRKLAREALLFCSLMTSTNPASDELTLLREAIFTLQDTVSAFQKENSLLRQKIDALARRFFGQKSEQMDNRTLAFHRQFTEKGCPFRIKKSHQKHGSRFE